MIAFTHPCSTFLRWIALLILSVETRWATPSGQQSARYQWSLTFTIFGPQNAWRPFDPVELGLHGAEHGAEQTPDLPRMVMPVCLLVLSLCRTQIRSRLRTSFHQRDETLICLSVCLSVYLPVYLCLTQIQSRLKHLARENFCHQRDEVLVCVCLSVCLSIALCRSDQRLILEPAVTVTLTASLYLFLSACQTPPPSVCLRVCPLRW